MKILKFLFIILVTTWIANSCKTPEEQNDQEFTVTTRITRDPSFLLPSKSTATVETQINQYLYLTLANYDPYKLELIPVLLEVIPRRRIYS